MLRQRLLTLFCAVGVVSPALHAELMAADRARHSPPPDGSRNSAPLLAGLSVAEIWVRHRYVRLLDFAPAVELVPQLLPLKDLKHGVTQGKPNEVKIAGGVRQIDLLTSQAAPKHDPTLVGRIAMLAERVASAFDVTPATHKIVSIKMLVTPPRKPGKPSQGEQMVHWDYPRAYNTKNKFTFLMHLSAAPGQRTTALPRFEAHHQPDERTTNEEMKEFLPKLFDKSYYHSVPVQLASVSFFDEKVSHYGTANDSDEERIVVFVMSVEKDMPPEQAEVADNEQSYEWVQYGQVYGWTSLQFAQSLVRNAHERAVHRIFPAQYQREAAQTLQHFSLLEEYNSRAPAVFTLKA